MNKLLYLSIPCILGISALAKGQNVNRQRCRQLLAQLEESAADTNRISILLELGKFHIYKPGEAKPDLDSGFSYLLQARALNEKLKDPKWQNEIESMFVVGFMERGDVVQGKALFLRLIKDFQKKGKKEAEAALRLKWGTWLSTKVENYTEVLDNYQHAVSLYRETKNQEKEIKMLKEIAYIHYRQGNLDLSEIELEEVIKRYKAIHYKKLHYAYSILSNVSRLKGDFDKGLDYAIKCLKSMENTKDTTMSAAFYGDLGRIYLDIGNRQKGIEWYNKAFDKWRNEGLPSTGMYAAAGFIVRDLIEQKKAVEALKFINSLLYQIPALTKIQKGCVAQDLAYCYEALANYKEAERFYLESVGWFDNTPNDLEATQRIQYDIGKFYLNRNEFSKAGNYLRRVLTFFPQRNELAIIKDVHLMLFRVDSAQGNFVSAINHFRIHKSLNDSIFNTVKSRQIEELQIRYETDKKEQDIRALNNRSKEQETKLNEATIVKNFTFLGLVLLLVIIFLLYYQYRIKQRNNTEIGRKNEALQHLVEEKEWLLKEIHHRVKNNLQIVISLLSTQSKYLDSKEAKDAIRESRHRMQAMSLIHQKLYQSENSTLVNMKTYISELANYLETSFNMGKRIYFDLHMQAIQLDISQAIPIGLILNEAITNAIKYAFVSRENGIISIVMECGNDNAILLDICDNGIGLPESFDVNGSASMGMRLMKGLIKQIGGKLVIKSEQGVRIRIEFKTDSILKSVSIKEMRERAAVLS